MLSHEPMPPDVASPAELVCGALTLVPLGSVGVVLHHDLAREHQPLSGQLSLDGRSPQGAIVELHPVDTDDLWVVRPASRVGANGRLLLHAPHGTYRVTARRCPPRRERDGWIDGADLLPDRYAHPATTPWGIRLEPGRRDRLVLTIILPPHADRVAPASDVPSF